MAITKNGHTIDTLEDWAKHAGPKTSVRWHDHVSAKEAARCWLGVTSPALPRELESLLTTNSAFGRAEGILGSQNVNGPAIGALRYQLLTATAGALNAGRTRGIDRVVLLIQ